jgi:hypothetical protein
LNSGPSQAGSMRAGLGSTPWTGIIRKDADVERAAIEDACVGGDV